MDKKTIEAIMTALKKGFRVELVMLEDGSIAVQTVQRKKVKI